MSPEELLVQEFIKLGWKTVIVCLENDTEFRRVNSMPLEMTKALGLLDVVKFELYKQKGLKNEIPTTRLTR